MLMVFRSRSRFPAATWHGTYRGKHPKPALLPRLSPSLDKARALALHPTHTRWPTHNPGWLITLTNHTLGRIAHARSHHFPASISLLRDIWAYLVCFLLLKEPLLENFSSFVLRAHPCGTHLAKGSHQRQRHLPQIPLNRSSSAVWWGDAMAQFSFLQSKT